MKLKKESLGERFFIITIKGYLEKVWKKFKHLSNDFVSFDGFILTGKYEPVII